MRSIEASIEISATPEEVWQIISDLKRAPNWMPDVKERRFEDAESPKVGMRWQEQGLLRGKEYKIHYELTEWDPPDRLGYKQVSSKEGKYHWHEYILVEPLEGGRSRVTARLEYRMPSGLFGQLYERFVFRKDFHGTLENRLEALRELLEGTPDQD